MKLTVSTTTTTTATTTIPSSSAPRVKFSSSSSSSTQTSSDHYEPRLSGSARKLSKRSFPLIVSALLRSFALFDQWDDHLTGVVLRFAELLIPYKVFTLIEASHETGEPVQGSETTRAFPCDYTLRHVAVELAAERLGRKEKEVGLGGGDAELTADDYVRLWVPLRCLLRYLAYDTSKHGVNVTVDMMRECVERQGDDLDRWVCVPEDLQNVCRGYARAMDDQEVPILVETLRLECDEEKSQRAHTWPRRDVCDMQNVRIGDTLDILDEQGKWYQGIVRLVCGEGDPRHAAEVAVHYIGWGTKWDEWVPYRPRGANRRLAPLHDKTNLPYRGSRNKILRWWGVTPKDRAMHMAPFCDESRAAVYKWLRVNQRYDMRSEVRSVYGHEEMADLELRYFEQIAHLHTMGFADLRSNVYALLRSNGDVSDAVNVLLGAFEA